MKIKALLSISLILVFQSVKAQSGLDFKGIAKSDTGIIIIEGTYRGQNVYINNPYNAFRNSYAVISATLNGSFIPNFNSSTFEVDLATFRRGEYVNIEIQYKRSGYNPPLVLNPKAVRSRSTYEMVGLISVTDDLIEWHTRDETCQEPYVIERNVGIATDNWILVGSVIGLGSKISNNYSFLVNHYPDKNYYRIKQRDGTYRFRYSPIFTFVSTKPPIHLTKTNVTNKLRLSEESYYEIYDASGALISKGNAQEIDIEKIEPGTYFIQIQNTTKSFVKRK